MARLTRNIFAILRGLFCKIISLFKSNYSIGKKLRLFKNTEIRKNRNAKCSIGEDVKIDYNTVLSVQKNGILEIKNGVAIGFNSMIVCHKRIVIGENTMFGPNVYIYDHDHIYDDYGVKAKEYNTKEIIIGKNCWFGTGCIILKGTIVGDNCIIGAGTMLKGEYPSNSVIVDKREKIIKTNSKR